MRRAIWGHDLGHTDVPHTHTHTNEPPRAGVQLVVHITSTRQVTRATHVRNRICPRVKLIIKIIIILLIIFLGFIKSKSC